MHEYASRLVVLSLQQTCDFCPAQWKERTADDHPVYIKGRHGILSVRIGPAGGSEWDAVHGEELIRIPLEEADVLSSDDILSLLDNLDFTQLEKIMPFQEWLATDG